MNEGNPPVASPVGGESPPSPAQRPLSTWQRLVCVPLGFLWLAVLLVIAIPVCVYMTILYFAVRAVRSLSGRGSTTRNAGIALIGLCLIRAVTGGPQCGSPVAASGGAMQIVLRWTAPEPRRTGTFPDGVGREQEHRHVGRN